MGGRCEPTPWWPNASRAHGDVGVLAGASDSSGSLSPCRRPSLIVAFAKRLRGRGRRGGSRPKSESSRTTLLSINGSAAGDTNAGQRIGRLTGLRDDLAHGKGMTVERAPSYLEDLKVFKTSPQQDLSRFFVALCFKRSAVRGREACASSTASTDALPTVRGSRVTT